MRPSGFGKAAAVMLIVLAPATAAAQSPAPRDGGFPDAQFELLFRKYTPPRNDFSPFAAWDAHMRVDVTIVRRGAHTVNFPAEFQTIGTETIGAHVGVAGTGYRFGFNYRRTLSEDASWSAGIMHFSSHLTRDLDRKIDAEKHLGDPIPVIRDPGEFNILFARLHRALRRAPLAPAFDIVFQPMDCALSTSFPYLHKSGRADSIRPLYIASDWALWRGRLGRLSAESEHEVGPRPVNRVSLVFALFDERQTFASASPGHDAHVSPMMGALRDGMSIGFRLRFRAI